jgi:hypothetical protein
LLERVSRFLGSVVLINTALESTSDIEQETYLTAAFELQRVSGMACGDPLLWRAVGTVLIDEDRLEGVQARALKLFLGFAAT